MTSDVWEFSFSLLHHLEKDNPESYFRPSSYASTTHTCLKNLQQALRLQIDVFNKRQSCSLKEKLGNERGITVSPVNHSQSSQSQASCVWVRRPKAASFSVSVPLPCDAAGAADSPGSEEAHGAFTLTGLSSGFPALWKEKKSIILGWIQFYFNSVHRCNTASHKQIKSSDFLNICRNAYLPDDNICIS